MLEELLGSLRKLRILQVVCAQPRKEFAFRELSPLVGQSFCSTTPALRGPLALRRVLVEPRDRPAAEGGDGVRESVDAAGQTGRSPGAPSWSAVQPPSDRGPQQCDPVTPGQRLIPLRSLPKEFSGDLAHANPFLVFRVSNIGPLHGSRAAPGCCLSVRSMSVSKPT